MSQAARYECRVLTVLGSSIGSRHFRRRCHQVVTKNGYRDFPIFYLNHSI
jgi:hypothetical protein